MDAFCLCNQMMLNCEHPSAGDGRFVFAIRSDPIQSKNLARNKVPRILIRITQAIFSLTLLYFWIVPPTMRNDMVLYIGLFVTASVALLLSIAHRQALRT
jgi:hypothetical protein